MRATTTEILNMAYQPYQHCRFCQSPRIIKYGIKADTQYYKCNDCRRKFAGHDSPEYMRFSSSIIGSALDLFYEGLSLGGISRYLSVVDNIQVNPATVWRWIIKYSKQADKQFSNKVKITSSRRWIIRETALNLDGRRYWIWDIMNAEDSSLLVSYISETRNIDSVVNTLKKAKNRTSGLPVEIVSDGVKIFPHAIENVFGADTINIRNKDLISKPEISVFETFQQTINERNNKIMRRLKAIESIKIVLNGFVIHYNFFCHHQSSNYRMPATLAGPKFPFKTWAELVRDCPSDDAEQPPMLINQ